MLRSMTGFGAAQAEVEGVAYAVEIRSVNNRYFKTSIRLPEIWSQAETEIEKTLRDKIHRGSINVKISMRLPDEKAASRVNVAALRSYLNELKMLDLDDPTLRIDLGALMALPGVCESPPIEELCEATHDGLMKLLDQALDGLVEMRCREGQALASELLGQCDVVADSLGAVAARAPQVVKDYQQRLGERVNELLANGKISVGTDDLAREVAIFADKCDINEEVARLTAHLEHFRTTTEAKTATGRKLDFIAQEMLREANTIASKATDTEIARVVVDIKSAIDRIKEQVANVE